MDVRIAGQLAVALGVGLVIGLERERRKAQGRSLAGIRTFGLVSLAGGLALLLGGAILLASATLAVTALAAIRYLQTPEDRGLTTEMALLAALLLGALAVRDPAIAAGLAVIVAILLAVRDELHRFVRSVLSERELDDALLFAAATLVVLPLLPATPVGPYGVLVPRTVWELAVLVMAISAAGYIAQRALGPRLGLPVAGFVSGFVSSLATIGTFGVRAREDRSLERPAVAGAALSNVSTLAQVAAILFVVDPEVFLAAAAPLAAAVIVAAAYGGVFMPRDLEHTTHAEAAEGRAFDLRVAVGFAAVVTLVLLVAAVLNARLGAGGVVIGMTLTGFADTHSVAFSVASLNAGGKLPVSAAVIALVAALTANSATKAVTAFVAGGRRYGARLAPGLALIALAAWAGTLVRL